MTMTGAASRGAATLMCMGTGSHVGKSVLVAALCRIYARRGYRVAPFKAQNMALNSFVTPEGAEIGRSQAAQARAAGVEPHVDMNPVLLKPSSQLGCQVVLLGRPAGHMSSEEYRAAQGAIWPRVTAALERLRAANDLVVIEGAGSAAEINLRDGDIVNMRVALYAQSPTLLVGDIDRGGVFAAFVGHMELFAPDERALIKGYVINKFRGDADLLEPGLEYLESRTGVATVGVVPFLDGWQGDEEDAVALDEPVRRQLPDSAVRIAVVRLPYLSNFTDFDALAAEPDVDVRYVRTSSELHGAAVIVLPGTKDTIADLAWLRRSGLADGVLAAAAKGTPVIGICGGYQMLGRRVLDPHGVESHEREAAGLGLLDVETTFGDEKRTVRVDGELLVAGIVGEPGTPVRGYEIHMGRTTLGGGAVPALRLRSPGGSVHLDGALSAEAPSPASVAPFAPRAEGQVFGCYVHGLFDEPAAREAFLNGLRDRLGRPRRAVQVRADDDVERFADHVEEHIDLGQLARMTGLPL